MLINDRYHAAALLLTSSLPLPLISTFNVQPSSTAPMEFMEKVRNALGRFFGIKPPEDSACPSNSNQGSIDIVPGAHDPGPGNDAGSTEPTASSTGVHVFSNAHDIAISGGAFYTADTVSGTFRYSPVQLMALGLLQINIHEDEETKTLQVDTIVLSGYKLAHPSHLA